MFINLNIFFILNYLFFGNDLKLLYCDISGIVILYFDYTIKFYT